MKNWSRRSCWMKNWFRRSLDEELVQKIVMDEKLVQNGVMSEKFVKNFVMGVKIDPKVVKDLSVFKIGGWNILQPSNRKLSEEYINGNEPRFVDQNSKQRFILCDTVCDNPNVKESKPICEDLRSCDNAMLRATALCSQ